MNLRQEPTSTQRMALIKAENPHLSSLTDVYPPELSEKLLKNKQKLDAIAKAFDNASQGISKAVIFMTCKGPKCPHSSSCVLLKNDIAPETYSCPIEMKVCMEVESALIDELEIDPQSTVDMELLYDLIDTKLLDMRTSGLIAKGSLIQTITVETGRTKVVSKDIAPEVKIKLDLKKLKHSIMTDFLATRRAKKRYGVGNGQGGLAEIISDAIKRKKSDDQDS